MPVAHLEGQDQILSFLPLHLAVVAAELAVLEMAATVVQVVAAVKIAMALVELGQLGRVLLVATGLEIPAAPEAEPVKLAVLETVVILVEQVETVLLPQLLVQA